MDKCDELANGIVGQYAWCEDAQGHFHTVPRQDRSIDSVTSECVFLINSAVRTINEALFTQTHHGEPLDMDIESWYSQVYWIHSIHISLVVVTIEEFMYWSSALARRMEEAYNDFRAD